MFKGTVFFSFYTCVSENHYKTLLRYDLHLIQIIITRIIGTRHVVVNYHPPASTQLKLQEILGYNKTVKILLSLKSSKVSHYRNGFWSNKNQMFLFLSQCTQFCLFSAFLLMLRIIDIHCAWAAGEHKWLPIFIHIVNVVEKDCHMYLGGSSNGHLKRDFEYQQ